MTDRWPILLAALVMAVVVVGAVAVQLRNARKAVRNLRQLAERFGLSFPEPTSRWVFMTKLPAVSGVYRGREVRIYAFTTGSGKSRQSWAAVRAACVNPNRLRFEVVPRNWLVKVGELFGRKGTILTGDAGFDEHWRLRGNDGVYLRAAFIPEIRDRFKACGQAGLTGGRFEGREGDVCYQERGLFSSQRRALRFVELTGLVCDLADITEVYQPVASPDSK